MLLDISISKASKKPVVPAMKKGEWRIVRKFDDGLVEIEDHRGRRYRGDVWVCERCSVRTFRKPSIILQPKICNSCADALRVERSKEMDRRAMERRVLMFEQGNTSPQRRNAIFLLACVRWRDRKAIRDIYAEAKRKTAETGIPHDVDHIYPLQGLLGCGLHVHWNLTVMPASENRSKGNEFPLDESPAWDGCGVGEILREFNNMVAQFNGAVDNGREITPNQARS